MYNVPNSILKYLFFCQWKIESTFSYHFYFHCSSNATNGEFTDLSDDESDIEVEPLVLLTASHLYAVSENNLIIKFEFT